MYLKKISRILILVFIFNILFTNVNVLESKAESKNEYNFIELEEDIKDMQVFNDNVLVINKDGEATFYKGEERVSLDGKGYIFISNKYVKNDNGDIFDIENGEFLNNEIKDYILNVYNILESDNESNIYFFENSFTEISKSETGINLRYYIVEDGKYILKNEISDLEAEYISFDLVGNIYLVNDNKLIKYQDSKNIIENLNGFKAKYIDENNILIFKDNKYTVVNSKQNTEAEKSNIKNEETTTEDIKSSSEIQNIDEEQDVKSNNSNVSYQTHIQNEGWQSFKSDGQISGTQGKALRLEGIKITANLPEGASITYRTHIQDLGWQSWKYDGEMSGTEGMSKRLEGIEIKLINSPVEYHVEYRVHIQNLGWQSWRRDGAMAGTEGESKRLEAIEIRIVKEKSLDSLSYQLLARNEGWSNNVSTGETSGQLRNPLKAIKINWPSEDGNFSIQYRAHVQNEGWHNWVQSGQVSGSENSDNLLEALEIKLVNAPSNYHILYRVNVNGYGWQGWKQDGSEAGTTGLSGQIVGIQIKIVKDIAEPTISYLTHVQNEGWQGSKVNGQISGTTGKYLRLEGIKIQLANLESSNSVIYRTHVQNIGWQNWVSDGQMSGTEGEALRLEAIEIKLKNEIPGYKLYYRVHVQDYGWQEWKASGETAGTVGNSKRLEAIEIKLVKDKNKSIVIDAGHNFGGDDGAYSTHNGIKYVERDLNMDVASKLKRELQSKGFEVIMTRNPEDRETIGLRSSLEKRVNIANYLNADFFISIHQNSATAASASGVEVYYSTATPLTGGRLLKNGVEYNEMESRSYVSSEKVNKSKAISKALVDSISSKMNRKNRGTIDRDFFVVKNTHMPSVLVECGFISNAIEARKLADKSLQQTMAEIMANEINNQF
ncbi:MAG: N-acetylmuramoyl-L-alanine amidase [Turicibacter sp.]|nr:N-acetylmuramoyl-L-alanine amidase [Turicibacter sp.]